MVACSQCGVENPEGATFCNGCGARLVELPAAREQRKTATVVFCDVTGSTSLGEKLDPESLRRVMARYFESMQAVIARRSAAAPTSSASFPIARRSSASSAPCSPRQHDEWAVARRYMSAESIAKPLTDPAPDAEEVMSIPAAA
jgi:class 3 adenylate cyclase